MLIELEESSIYLGERLKVESLLAKVHAQGVGQFVADHEDALGETCFGGLVIEKETALLLCVESKRVLVTQCRPTLVIEVDTNLDGFKL